jgi:arylsulfatase
MGTRSRKNAKLAATMQLDQVGERAEAGGDLAADEFRLELRNAPVCDANTSYTSTADIEVPQAGAEGMILTSGGRFAGYGFYLLKGRPVFLWNMVDLERVKWEGADALPPGRHTLEFDFKYEGIGPGTLAFNDFSGVGRPGTGTLKVDGKEVATRKMERTLPMILQWDESFDIGSDTLTGVNDADYQPPFPLTAKLNKLTIKVDRPQLSPEDVKKLQAAMTEKVKAE